jgi:integrase
MKYTIREYRPGHYQVTFSHEGTQVHLQKFFDLPLDTESRAFTLVAWLKKNGYSPEKFGRDTPFQFDKAVQTWIKSSNPSEEWVQHLRSFANKLFIPHFKKMDIRNIKTAHIQAFYTTLLDKKYSPKYCKNVMGELHAFLNFYKKSLPNFPDFPKVEVQEPVIRWLTEEEQDKLFQHIPEVDKPIFELMRHYGCRCNEAGGLLHKNVFLDHDPPYFVIATTMQKNGKIKETTKTRMIRILPIVDVTRWIFEPRGDSPFVFSKGGRPYTNNRLNRVWNWANKVSGVQKINLYNGVRHSFACQRLNAGYTIEEVRVVLGHSSSRMTQRYAQYTLQSLENIIRGNVYAPFIPAPDVKLLDFKGKDKLGGEASALTRRL